MEESVMNDITIVIIDDEKIIVDYVSLYFKRLGYNINGFICPIAALSAIEASPVDILIADYRMPGLSGIEFLTSGKKKKAYTYGILFTAFADKEILEMGINQKLISRIIEKPLDLHKLRAVVDEGISVCRKIKEKKARVLRLEEQCRELKSRLGAEVIGLKGGLKEVFEKIRTIAGHSVNVLLTGETGTGKEVVAGLLHDMGPGKDENFVQIHCGAIPDTLLESELFGYEKGAFTGAANSKPGKIELAHKGTLFLDEIGDMKLDLQSKLLRVLQERRLERVGSNNIVTVDFNLISATNKNLAEEVKAGRFREDLFYRINGFPLHLPPLRERKEDLEDLVRYFLEKTGRKMNITPPVLDTSIISYISGYPWPGNIRELENIIARVLLTSGNPPSISRESFDFLFQEKRPNVLRHSEDGLGEVQRLESAFCCIRDAMIHTDLSFKNLEQNLLDRILEYFGGSISEAVKKTGINKNRFYRNR